MANPNIKQAALQANLSPQQQTQVDGLSKLLDSHRGLLGMPTDQAQAKFSQLTQDQQNAHVALFGGEQDSVKKQGWLGNALHYMSGAVKTTVAAPFKALNEVSDFMTRLYRTGAIALDQNVDLGKAFEIANDKGDKVFSPDRINDAQTKYGKDVVNVAMKIASGISRSEIIASGTETEKQIAANTEKDLLFQDALDAVQAAKYSPGRQLANLLLPGSLEGSGFLYKGISGVGDAAYRIFADPTLLLGKAKKAYDAGNFALFTLIGKETGTYGRSILRTAGDTAQVERVFQDKKIVDFFNVYGKQLDNLDKARKANDIKAGVEAATQLKRIAPEFGPAAVDEFLRAGVRDANTAKNYLANAEDIRFVLQGQAARKTPLIPRLDAARKARIAALTTGNRILDIDKAGRRLVDAVYGADEIQYGDISTGLFQNAEQIAKAERAVGKAKQDGSYRFSLNQLNERLDRFAKKFSTIPYFANGYFDVNAPDAADQIYRLARLTNTRYHSKIIKEAFAAGDENQRRQVFKGIWNTYAEIRQVSKGEAGLDYLVAQNGALPQQYAASRIVRQFDEAGQEIGSKVENPATFNGQAMAIDDTQLSSGIAVPSLYEMDILASRQTLFAKMFGPNYKEWANKLTTGWVFGTLAGPRFAIRNAAEDLMIHAAVGDSSWGLVKSRLLSTKLQLAAGKGDLGFINKLVRKADISKYQAEIKTALESGNVNAVRETMAKAVAESSLGAKLDKRGADLLARYIKHGDIDNLLASVAEGGNNATRGLDQYLKVTEDVSKYGSVDRLTINGKDYKAKTGSSFADFNPVVTEETRAGWLVKLGMFGASDLRRQTILNLSDNIPRDMAINNIRKYLEELPEKARNRFELYKNGGDVQQHATALYDDTRLYFSKRNGELNKELLNKVRFYGEDGNLRVSTSKLTLDDLPTSMQADLAPESISIPMLIPVNDTPNFASDVMEWGWKKMGDANARFSRHPMVIDAVINMQKEMQDSGFERHFIEKFTAGKTGEELIKAQDLAEKHLLSIAEDFAKQRVLAFVDNPAVRSQLAMSVANFARFYRATEDFYRRMVRTVRYNPEALVRASLTYEGIAHSGFVQTDDNGDSYFFYPGLEPVYKAMNKTMRLFGVQDAFKVPMPVEFGGKLKMITPSMNPDSLFPTFAGPLAAVPIKMIGNVVPQVKELEQYLTGSYGVDQPLISAVLPAHVNRLLQTLNKDERNSQYASAYRKGVTYLEATGHGLEIKVDPVTGQEIAPSAGEIAAYQDKLQAATLTVLSLRFLFGFVAPASPQVMLKSDMSKWVRDNGEVSYKQTFNKLIQRYGSVDKATQEWIRLFPDEMPYTVSESQSNTTAQVRAVSAAGNWVQEHKDLLAKYPQGAAFLIPQAGNFDFNAYKLLFKSNLKENKTLTDFVRQASSAKDLQYYYSQKEMFDSQLAMTYSTDAKRMLRDQWQVWSEQYKGARPFLQDQLGAGSQVAIERTRALEDLRKMLDDKTITVQPQLRNILANMVGQYDQYKFTRETLTSNSGVQQNYKDMLKMNIKSTLQNLAQQDPNAQSAYDILFARLIGD